jgi:cation diffusion facilitator CzcD-associated flavoprotein CzcO
MLAWLVVGGGIHGTYLTLRLIAAGQVNREDIRILDPNPQLLHTWLRQTRNCGMRFLRSPSTHNLDTGILSLYRFAQKTVPSTPQSAFTDPYLRPSLALFNSHCHNVLEKNDLASLHIRQRAVSLERTPNGFSVVTGTEHLHARRILLAIGLGEQPYWPQWAMGLRGATGSLHHVLDPTFDRSRLEIEAGIHIVGAGLTGVQTALALEKASEAPVTLIGNRPLRVHQLDFDPCWIGPKCLRDFGRLAFSQRRQVIDQARNKGSVPPEIAAELEAAIRRGRIRFWQRTIRSARCENQKFILQSEQAQPLMADQLILATGFDPRRPGGVFVDRMIKALDLKVAADGYPIVGPGLQWQPDLFVTGPLAELELGPCARNIIGARNGAKAMLAHL